MAIYQDIIRTLGKNLLEYNVGAWALFRDQMATEISSHYIFGGGAKPDESLVNYSIPYIDRSNRLTKGEQDPESLAPRSKFTYYTNEGPKEKLDSKPILANPESDILSIDRDYKVKLDESTQTIDSGRRLISVYDENGSIGEERIESALDKSLYNGIVTKYTNGETLLSKTDRWFKNETYDYISKRFSTLVSRFHTNNTQIPISELKDSVAVQGFSSIYGLSRGRNLRKRRTTDENGYDDPYCRVWTWHKQYSRIGADTMRPFFTGDTPIDYVNGLEDGYNWSIFRTPKTEGFLSGGERLSKYGSMYDNLGHSNGLVNITPSFHRDALTYSDLRNVSVEHCMFSIENLAWKGTFSDYSSDESEEFGLSREQKGPLGGRIMWFPPYDIKFNETSQANWQSNEFIGRGEPIYTYSNTTRGGNLSFKLLIDHPAILDYWERRSEIGNPAQSGTDDIESKEQELLRFFAGCEVLKAKNQEPEQIQEPIKKDNTEAPPSNGDKKIQFFVFFPNNYSGCDDKNNSDIIPAEYLINGIGTNIQNLGTEKEPKEDVWATNVIEKYYKDSNQTYQVGGYEMRDGVGISIVKEETNTNTITTVYTLSDSVLDIELRKMVGSEASKSETYNGPQWHKRRYYYRADKKTLNEVLVGGENNGAVSYIDKTSYQLNSVNYTKAISEFDIKDQENVYSFAEIFVALNDDSNSVLSGLYNQDRVKELKSIFNQERGAIKKIICRGSASEQGNNDNKNVNTKRNDRLAKDRALTIKDWLRKSTHEILGDNPIEFENGIFEINNKKKDFVTDDSNDYYAKLHRFVFVEIIYGSEETEDASATQVISDGSGGTENNSSTISNDDKNPIIEDNNKEVYQNRTSSTDVPRYDNEARFFQKLTKNEPFMAKLLSERIKNFDPVFHSMSPEGFNARLTFLNQCMRQGPTISSSETNNNNPNNLSFGRPPVCVLRVGDFYNTKIIITSMTIDYDPLVWDLNQEGIGVMPMIANISLNFNFIGGSDLAGPIQRLQNATSFNYYANTSVYDNRSEEIKYEDGEVDLFKAYKP